MSITIRQLTPVCGAEITNVDLTRPLPPDSTEGAEGGQTQFASLRAAYDALPDARKREIENMAAIHHYAYSRRINGIQRTTIALHCIARDPMPSPSTRAFCIGPRSRVMGPRCNSASSLRTRLQKLGYDATGSTLGNLRECGNITGAEIRNADRRITYKLL